MQQHKIGIIMNGVTGRMGTNQHLLRSIAEIIKQGLSDRYKAFYGVEIAHSGTFGFEVLNEPKSVLVKIKANTPEQIRIRGYQCQFRMRGPKELMRVMYDSGIGSLGSQGFGCVQLLKK